jgi:hypothetical protein
MLHDGIDTLIISDRSKHLTNKLRSAISAKFDRIWIYVCKNPESNVYELYVASWLGGKVEDSEATAIKHFATKFMLDPENIDDFLKE